MNPVAQWVEDVEASIDAINNAAGPGDGDVPVLLIRDFLVRVAVGYPYLYDNGIVCKILVDDGYNRINELNRLDLQPHVTVHELVERELAEAGGNVHSLRVGPHWGTREVLWSVRVFRFVAKLFEELGVPNGPSVGAAGQATYAAVLQPFHGWLKGTIVSFVLGMAPSREHLLQRAGLDRHRDAEGVALMLRVVRAVDPVAVRLHRYYTNRGYDFPDKV
jgi:hypothetical protein